jgi:type VI secretion system protein ImpH
MVAKNGDDLSTLIRDLKDHGPEYNVFQAILVGEAIARSTPSDEKQGEGQQLALRLRPYEMYVYPARDIKSCTYEDGVLTYVLTFMGLYGINSPVPRCYHEQVALQQSTHGSGEVPLQNFLDLFNNRFYRLYYQAWKKSRVFLGMAEPSDSSVSILLSLSGLKDLLGRKRHSLPMATLIRLTGILSSRVRNAVGLAILLGEFMPEFKPRVKEFVPTRVPLDGRPSLGRPSSFKLGKTSIVGRSVLDFRRRICVELGPLSFSEYLELVPGGRRASVLRDLLDIYLRDSMETDVRFTIVSSSITTIPLSDRRIRLGSSFWVGRPRESVVSAYFKHERYSQST